MKVVRESPKVRKSESPKVEKKLDKVGSDLPDAVKYGISIASSLLFKSELPAPGNVFFLATFNKIIRNGEMSEGKKVSEAYQVAIANIKKYGRALCEQSVVMQVVQRHFAEPEPVSKIISIN